MCSQQAPPLARVVAHVGMPGKQSPTSNTPLYRFWEPIMQPLYENCMTLIARSLPCNPLGYSPYSPLKRGNDWSGMPYGLEATAGVDDEFRR